MKKIAFIFLVAASLMACKDKSKDIINNGAKTGRLTVAVEADLVFATKAEVMPSLADLEVEIRNSSDNSLWRRWDKYGDGIGQIDDINAGNYVISAYSGTLEMAAFEKPYVHGEQGFVVNPDQTTPVTLTSRLKNSKITVTFTDKLKAAVKDIEAVVTGVTGGILEYTPQETRGGYFAIPDDGVVTIVVNGKRISNNSPINQKQTITAFQASQWHKVTVDLVSTVGNAGFIIGIDTELIEKDLGIEVPDVDDITGGTEDPDLPGEPSNGPTIVGSNYLGNPFNIANELTVTSTQIEQAGEGMQLDLLIDATGGIKNLFVTIDSPTLPESLLGGMGLWGEFDIANLVPGSNTEGSLEMVGLVDPARPIKGKTSHVFSLGGFMGLISSVGGMDEKHTFRLRVVDGNDNAVSANLVINIVTA